MIYSTFDWHILHILHVIVLVVLSSANEGIVGFHDSFSSANSSHYFSFLISIFNFALFFPFFIIYHYLFIIFTSMFIGAKNSGKTYWLVRKIKNYLVHCFSSFYFTKHIIIFIIWVKLFSSFLYGVRIWITWFISHYFDHFFHESVSIFINQLFWFNYYLHTIIFLLFHYFVFIMFIIF
jgi:hypothetical protein